MGTIPSHHRVHRARRAAARRVRHHLRPIGRSGRQGRKGERERRRAVAVGEGAQRGVELGAARTRLWVPLRRPAHDVAQRLGKGVARIEGRALQLAGGDEAGGGGGRHGRLDLERLRAGDGLVEDEAERVHVHAAGIRRLVAEGLRREIGERPAVHGGDGVVAVPLQGDPEVHQAHEPRAAEDDVRGLHVAVEDPGGVRVLQRGGQRHEDGESVGQGHRPALEMRGEGLALHQLHGQVEDGMDRVLAEAHHPHDGGMVEGGERLRLAHEAVAAVRLLRRLHHLEGGGQALGESGVHAVHRAHASFAERRVDHPVPDPLAGLEHWPHHMAQAWTPCASPSPAPSRRPWPTAS